jgi:hypothetical protein
MGRPKMYQEEMRLVNFRFPVSLLDELEEIRSAMGLPSVAETVRAAIRSYAETNKPVIEGVRRLREKHGT